MAKKTKKASKSCKGLKGKGKLKKGWRYKKGGKCPVKAKGKK